MTRGLGIGQGHNHRDIRRRRRRREPLLAIEHIVALAILDRRGLHAGCIGTGSLFGHRIADPLVAIEQRLEVLFLLKRRAVGQQGQHGRIIGTLAVHRQGAEMALAQFHLNQSVGQRA